MKDRYAVIAEDGDLVLGFNKRWYRRNEWAGVLGTFATKRAAERAAERERVVIGSSVRVIKVGRF